MSIQIYLVLRAKIGTCPNTEANIEVIDNSPFFIRPFHVKEEDKSFTVKEILKKVSSVYSSPVTLIRRKVHIDKRYINISIAKHNLAFPLQKDTLASWQIQSVKH